MSLEITLSLDDQDLEHFRKVMESAQERASGVPEQDVAAKAQETLDKVSSDARAPHFVKAKLSQLQCLITMLHDPDWPLGAEERTDVVSALAYFYDPKDIIDDSVPVLGLLDDAIMIELVTREMRNEIQAYEDFCAYRTREEAKGGRDVSREDWLASKRKELMDGMRNRMHSRSRGGRFTRFSFR